MSARPRRTSVADSGNMGKPPAFVRPIGEIHMMITDTLGTDKAIAPFLERGIEVKPV